MDTRAIRSLSPFLLAAPSDAALINGHISWHRLHNGCQLAAPSDAALINGHIDRIHRLLREERAAPSDAALINGHRRLALRYCSCHRAAPSDAALINGHQDAWINKTNSARRTVRRGPDQWTLLNMFRSVNKTNRRTVRRGPDQWTRMARTEFNTIILPHRPTRP